MGHRQRRMVAVSRSRARVVLLWGNNVTLSRFWWSLALVLVVLAVVQVLVGAGRGNGSCALAQLRSCFQRAVCHRVLVLAQVEEEPGKEAVRREREEERGSPSIHGLTASAALPVHWPSR